MRKSFFLHSAVLLLATVSPAIVCQQFHQPSDEELKMTSDPAAPGAAAVYLDYEENANDPMHVQVYYARIKVLTEKGKEQATVELPYLRGVWKVTDIQGRTIHADGTIVPLEGKPEDLLSAKKGDLQFGRKVFTLPSVEVGSVLEYRYEIHYDEDIYSSPEWLIQRRYFVHKAHFSFTPFKAFMPQGTPDRGTGRYLIDERGREATCLVWWSILPAGASIKTSVNGSFNLDVADVPAAPSEAWMPPIESLLYKVRFYYSFAHDPGTYWLSEGKFWSRDVDKFAEPSEAIKSAVAGLIAPGDSDLDKAKKLYAAVQALDNTDYSRKKSESEMKALKIKEARHAEDTWTQKSGSSEDIAMLYLAMLRAAGLNAYAIKVVDRDRAEFDPSYQSLGQLNATLVMLETGGKQTVTDPGQKMCMFGMLNWRHAGARGLAQSSQGISFSTTPVQNFKENSVNRVADLTLDEHGAVSGRIQISMTGQPALYWRQAALRMDGGELKKQYDHELESILPDGVVAHVDHFLALDRPDQMLMAVVNVTGTPGTATSRRILLPGLFFETRAMKPFVNEEKRQEPVDMHYGDHVTDDVTYQLPAGLTVEGAPQDSTVSWAGHAIFVIKSKPGADNIEIVNSLARAFTLAKPEEYGDLRGFYQKVAEADQAQLVLMIDSSTPPAGKSH
jgi:hypothetical protein